MVAEAKKTEIFFFEVVIARHGMQHNPVNIQYQNLYDFHKFKIDFISQYSLHTRAAIKCEIGHKKPLWFVVSLFIC